MHVAIVDDEENALNYLEDLLLAHTDIQEVSKYLEPYDVIEDITNNSFSIIFLDINMPKFHGIDLANVIKEKDPNVHIVFVTAYNEYAVEAFDIAATDYLMKPVFKNRLDQSLSKVKRLMGTTTYPSLKISLLNRTHLELPNGEHTLIQFNMTKTQHLFIYLLHNRDRLVRKEYLIDMLWADLEEKNALSQLYNAIYMIRKELAPFEKFIYISTFSDSYRLNTKNIMIDVDEFEKSTLELPLLDENTFKLHQEVIDSYTGNYLIDYDYLWVENERYRLQTLWVNMALDLLYWYFSNNKYDEAVKLCLLICSIAPLTEEAYYYLMKISAEKKANSSVHYHYSQLCDVLYRDIQEEPSEKITNWYENWKSKKI